MTSTTPDIATIDDAVVATVAYSDVFDMPLDRRHLRRFLLGMRATENELDDAVARGVSSGSIISRDGLLHLPGREDVLDVHADRTQRAQVMWRQAGKWARWLGRVPWVRAVAVTGGLACDSVADHDDIDYAIITEPGRLWLARLGCTAVVKIAARTDVEVCPNFLLATDALALEVESAYTARELAQMVDMVGPDLLDDFREANRWMLDHLPNASVEGDRSRVLEPGFAPLRRLVEMVGGLGAFDAVESWEMRRKIERLTQVASRRAEVGRPDESSFSPSICKGHMVGNAAGIEVAWRTRLGRST